MITRGCRKGSAPAGPPAAIPGVGSISALQPAPSWERHPGRAGGSRSDPTVPSRPWGACGSGNKGSWQGTAPPDANLPVASHPLCVSLKIPRRRKFVLRGGCSPPREGLPELPRPQNSPQPRFCAKIAPSSAPALPRLGQAGAGGLQPCPQPTHGSQAPGTRTQPRSIQKEALGTPKRPSLITGRMRDPRSPCRVPSPCTPR